MGLAPLAHELVYSYVGNGAPVLIRRALGPEASEENCQRALQFFLHYYREHMLDHTVLYPGIREALDRLHAQGVTLAVLTNKPVRFSIGILSGLGVDLHFLRIYGGNSFEQKKPDPVGVAALIGESGISRERVLIVGDSAVDVRTARNAGVKSCGVTWGFQPETFAAESPDFLVQTAEEMTGLVLS
jgi:phosphoglycolate phosphatase